MLGESEAAATIPTKDLGKAKQFYQDTLGLKVVQESQGGVVMEAGKGSRVFVYQTDLAGTNQATAAGWVVVSVEDTVNALKAKGVNMEHYDIPGTTREGDVQIMGELKAAWFKDPDGNILSVSNRMG